ncbi:hypothetical protein H4F17_13570 [Vibrio cholerae]
MRKLIILTFTILCGVVSAGEKSINDELLDGTGRVDAVIEYCHHTGYIGEEDATTMQIANLKKTMITMNVSMNEVMLSHWYLRGYRNYIPHLHQINDEVFRQYCNNLFKLFAQDIFDHEARTKGYK